MKEGWVCPKCGRVYGPMMMTCAYCNAIIDGINKTSFVATINAEKTGE